MHSKQAFRLWSVNVGMNSACTIKVCHANIARRKGLIMPLQTNNELDMYTNYQGFFIPDFLALSITLASRKLESGSVPPPVFTALTISVTYL